MIIYYVKERQSLVELCRELQLENPEYLKEYHNQNCSLTERFEGDLTRGMKLYIPSSQEVLEINKKIREENKSFYNFPVNGRFPFEFKLWVGTYQITQTTYSDDIILTKYDNKIRLHFEGIKNGYYHFLFSAFDFRRNEDTSDTKADALAQMCIETIYPIRYVIDIDGKLMDVVLTKKTEDIISELDAIKNFFQDQYSSGYIEKIKDVVANPETISKKFKNTLLNTFMFGEFYRTKLEGWTDSEIYYDFYPWIFEAQPIRFEFQNTLVPKDSLDDEWIKILQKGISVDNRSLEDLYLEHSHYDDNTEITGKSIDCEHFAEYIFNREKCSLQKIEARFQCFRGGSTISEDFSLEKIPNNYYI
ncbi:hypothetical protein [Chryseobacterium sp. Marseille-Q3244]|uniref:hypothetical protein n=1 Tax=Chryseobacterium sp. Marseille-Q3244 TaxID=2758092 RepID=UPI0020240CEF|nr:hypothetical protein [Chryseobacterium sp. Marseille-Q3244]